VYIIRSFFTSSSLASLDVSKNELAYLPDPTNFTALTTLEASQNRLSALPDTIGCLTSMHTLNLEEVRFIFCVCLVCIFLLIVM